MCKICFCRPCRKPQFHSDECRCAVALAGVDCNPPEWVSDDESDGAHTEFVSVGWSRKWPVGMIKKKPSCMKKKKNDVKKRPAMRTADDVKKRQLVMTTAAAHQTE